MKMKYYELYVDLYWLGKTEVAIQELNVVKETPKQLQIRGSKTYISRVNKAELLELKGGSFSKHIFFAEGQEEQAKQIMKEELERELDYHRNKVSKFEQALKEL